MVEPGSSPGLHEHRRGDSHGTLGRHAVDLHVREGGRRLNVRTSLACAVACASLVLIAAGRAVAADAGAAPPVLQAVVVVSRHGVRSPTKLGELDAYAAQPWPAWPVGPGELTPHGAMLMTAFGRAYRESFAAAGLRGAECPPAGSAYVWADIDERTRATGEALAAGFAPGCALRVNSSDAGVDPLFHPIPTIAAADPALERAMLEGSIGGSPAAVVEAAGPAFSVLETVLGCDRRGATCRSIAGEPSSIVVSPKSGVASLGGSVALAATAAEDLILEYSEGQAPVGWGRVDRAKLLELSRLHALKERFENETPYMARIGASNLLMHVRATIDQAASGVRDAGTRAPVGARFVAFIGHDTNLAQIAGALRLSWFLPGFQQNETPPGGALVFEVWRPVGGGAAFVRTAFVAQSFDQMRDATAATDPRARPLRAPVAIPGCPSLDCPLANFDAIVAASVDPRFVAPW